MDKEIRQLVRKSASIQDYQVAESCVLPHKRLKIALAACPNACTQPQIKDVGIIARLFPSVIGADCNRCRRCEEICQEQAITIRTDKTQILDEHCIGCGVCVNRCPQKTIKSEGLVFQILMGGRMGRHPKWAQEFCVVDSNKMKKVIECFFDKIIPMLSPDERISELIKRMSLVKLREEILPLQIQNRGIDGN